MFGKLRSLFASKAPPPIDPREAFATEVEAYLRSLPDVTEATRAPEGYAFDVVTPAKRWRIYLDNAFAETRELSPEARQEKIAFFFAPEARHDPVDDEREETWDSACETFVPVLRGATYGLEMWLQKPRAEFVRRPFLPFVDRIVAMDRLRSMVFVSRGTVERWEVDEGQVFDAADARVPLLADPSVDIYDVTHGPLWVVTTNDTYESSRLLVPGWLASFRGKVQGRPIAIAPERSTLMVGGDARPDMVERLLEKAEREFGASNRRLSPAPYTVDDEDRVVPYVRPEADALGIKVKLAHERLAAYEYGHQKEALEGAYAKAGPDVFVASYRVYGAEGAMPRSLCVWTQGIRSYLPRTDRVAMVVPGDREGEPAKVTVEVAFEAVVDRLTAVPGLHPPRYETGSFPGQSELTALTIPRT